MSLWTRKSIGLLQAEAGGEGIEESQRLRRALGPLNLTTLGIGAIIGAGIFVLTGTVAAQYAGPGIVYSLLLAGTGVAAAADYDIVISGGRVMDPESGFDKVANVGVKDGRVVTISDTKLSGKVELETSRSTREMPRPVEALPCGSRSTMSTRSPIAASAVARFIAVVVLPTPPF